MLPNAEAGFAASEVLGVAGLNAEEPNAEVRWFAKAPNPPVAGLIILDEVDEVVLPNAEVFWVGVAKDPNMLFFGVSVLVDVLGPPNESPPNPLPPVSTSADMGSSELEIAMAIGEGGAGLPPGCIVVGGARLGEPKPNFAGLAVANAPNPPEDAGPAAGVAEAVLPKPDDCPKPPDDEPAEDPNAVCPKPEPLAWPKAEVDCTAWAGEVEGPVSAKLLTLMDGAIGCEVDAVATSCVEPGLIIPGYGFARVLSRFHATSVPSLA